MAFSSAMFGPNTGTSMAQRSAASAAGKKISQMGRGGDTMAIHASPFTKNLLKALGGSGGVNPKTGLTEFQLEDLEGEGNIEEEQPLTVFPGMETTGGAYDGMSYGSYGAGDNNYAFDLGLQVNTLGGDGYSDSYSQNDAGELVYTNYAGDAYTLDPSKIDADFSSTNFMPNYGDLKYFTANTVAGTGETGETGATDETVTLNPYDAYGDFGYGEDGYKVSPTARNLAAQNPDEYSIDASGNLVFTAANGDTYTLDAAKLDADFTSTNYRPNTENLKYFNSNNTGATNLPAGVTAVDFRGSSQEEIGGELLQLGSDGKYYLNGVLATGDDSRSTAGTTRYVDGVKQMVGSVNLSDTQAASKNPADYDTIGDVGFSAEMIQKALSDASIGDGSGLYSEYDINGDGIINQQDALELFQQMDGDASALNNSVNNSASTGATDVFDESGVKIGTMLDGVFTPIDTSGTGGTGLTDTVVDGVLANTDPNDFAGQIAALKAEIKKLTSSAEEDIEVDGTNDFDGLIGKLEELFEKYMSSGYSPAALMNMFGFTSGDTSNDFNYMIPTYSGSDNVYTRKAVKDRDTGETRYINVPIGDMASGGGSFQENRRAGFGSMF